MEMRVYKIREKETDMFSRGSKGTWKIWSKTGKCWFNIKHVKDHLNQFIDFDGKIAHNYPYANAEIVEITANDDECRCDTYDVELLMKEMSIKKKEIKNKFIKYIKNSV